MDSAESLVSVRTFPLRDRSEADYLAEFLEARGVTALISDEAESDDTTSVYVYASDAEAARGLAKEFAANEDAAVRESLERGSSGVRSYRYAALIQFVLLPLALLFGNAGYWAWHSVAEVNPDYRFLGMNDQMIAGLLFVSGVAFLVGVIALERRGVVNFVHRAA